MITWIIENIFRATYLCFCGPLIPLLFLSTAESAIWNELSVYKLERVDKKTSQQC